MRAPISVIIPTLNAAQALPGCLAPLYEGLHQGLIRELIFADGGSSDDTQALAEAAGAVFVSGPPSRGGQLRRGVAQAQGAWYLIVHADTRLQPGWTAALAPLLSGRGAYYGQLRFDADGVPPRLVAGWANLRALLFRLPYGDQALLVDAHSYAADVALARALRKQLRPGPLVAVTSADKYVRQGWTRRGARNLLTLARYFAGVDPHVLARAYRRP
jgi:glycosyltransferase involved in cell wall biosynthesis